ncbi:hypothetical protein [Maritimibacter sp. UBA3975]|uniref:hypothetical protein n=1 Tax=Maritimibacter sp. UBA3975 TaxID=1946833 RepID=UPI0025C2EC95|nr:hypothetical protein [Maritimibacter sp. UBA3975]|tara:strand:- start:25708 stop:26130 length:423 start_codon:yes stop_codon:yes gene_type:complete
MTFNKILENKNEKKAAAEIFAAKPVIDLFRIQQAEIWHAARLLGGCDASRIVDTCAARLEANQMIDNQTGFLLRQVLGLLALEEADDPDKPFMGFFALIDPNDPVVPNICLLTDQLRAALSLVERRRRWVARKKLPPIEA